MKITRKSLEAAEKEGILTSSQSSRLFEFLQSQPSVGSSFNFTHLLYYLGGMIAMGAMSIFMNLGWESFGGWGIVCISMVYAVIGLIVSNRFQRNGYSIPAGICATFTVVLTPFAIYGLQQALGVWPDDTHYRDYHRYIKWHWLYMEIGTLVVGIIIARIYKYPLLVMPIAVTLWYLFMDTAVMLTGGNAEYQLRALLSTYFGLLIIGIAFWVDIRARHTADYSFWLYMVGVITFWWGITAQYFDNEIPKWIYFCLNLLLMGGGVLLVRRVFVVFGAVGCSLYLGYLSFSLFKESWLFPVALTVIGFSIIYLGILWQKNEQYLTMKARGKLPKSLQELLESKDVS